MILVSRLLTLVVIIVMLVFCMSNLDSVTVKLLSWESPQMPLFLILLFVFFFGFSLALFWQAVRGVTANKVSRPSPVPIEKSGQEKVKRGWGLKKKSQVKEAETKDAAKDDVIVTESPASVVANVEESPDAEPASVTDK